MKHEFDMDFELNIAPIVDCLTVLITYLLASATFISLGMMSVALPSFNEEYPSSEKPQVTLTVQILKNNNIRVVSEGSENTSHEIDGDTLPKSLIELGKYLEIFKSRHDKLDGAVIAAEDSVEYNEVVQVIEATRAVLPQVAIGTEDVSSSLE